MVICMALTKSLKELPRKARTKNTVTACTMASVFQQLLIKLYIDDDVGYVGYDHYII
jgi:hypothetical protein